MEIIQLLISQATQFKWPVHLMDVKLVFLNGVFKKNVYVEQPLRYIKFEKEDKVLKHLTLAILAVLVYFGGG
jgi:Reverse transcriptase (RNA-dependent DNA polymerase)